MPEISELKQCPACNEQIQSAAIKCRYCRSDLTTEHNSEGDAPPSPSSAQAERECPFCSEMIKATAIKCKHCGSVLSATPLTPAVSGGSRRGINWSRDLRAIAILVLVLEIMGLLTIGPGLVLTLNLLFVLYFLPTINGYASGKRNAEAIACLNLFLGWTVIGWVVALVWSSTKD